MRYIFIREGCRISPGKQYATMRPGNEILQREKKKEQQMTNEMSERVHNLEENIHTVHLEEQQKHL